MTEATWSDWLRARQTWERWQSMCQINNAAPTGTKCESCRWLSLLKPKNKCLKYPKNLVGDGTDWNPEWQACGLWKPRP